MKFFIVVGCFILADIISGIIKALHSGTLDSSVLREGLFHKLGEILAMGGSYMFEVCGSYISLGFELPLLEVTSVYICLMESVSFIENICEINPQLKALFGKYLNKLNPKGE